jgi:hypothetical protein
LDWWRTDPRLSTSAANSPALSQPKHAASASRTQESSHGS